jgi:NTP pyrophosphatase (non-canonical NTP hydrolase)
MEFDKYQSHTKKTAVYPEENAVEYLALGVNGEAGEVAEKIKKSIRDDKDLGEDLQDELGDVLWYLARLLDELDYSFDETAERNLDKLLDRKERNKIKGEGNNR